MTLVIAYATCTFFSTEFLPLRTCPILLYPIRSAGFVCVKTFIRVGVWLGLVVAERGWAGGGNRPENLIPHPDARALSIGARSVFAVC
jgi:hypothetical protein